MDKKASSFMSFVGFECPLRIEEKLLIHLKSKNVNIDSEGTLSKIFEILLFRMGKWSENELTSP